MAILYFSYQDVLWMKVVFRHSFPTICSEAYLHYLTFEAVPRLHSPNCPCCLPTFSSMSESMPEDIFPETSFSVWENIVSRPKVSVARRTESTVSSGVSITANCYMDFMLGCRVGVYFPQETTNIKYREGRIATQLSNWSSTVRCNTSTLEKTNTSFTFKRN